MNHAELLDRYDTLVAMIRVRIEDGRQDPDAVLREKRGPVENLCDHRPALDDVFDGRTQGASDLDAARDDRGTVHHRVARPNQDRRDAMTRAEDDARREPVLLAVIREAIDGLPTIAEEIARALHLSREEFDARFVSGSFSWEQIRVIGLNYADLGVTSLARERGKLLAQLAELMYLADFTTFTLKATALPRSRESRAVVAEAALALTPQGSTAFQLIAYPALRECLAAYRG